MGTGMEEEVSQEAYKDFYKLWIETYSETFKEFLKSGHFSSDMGMLLSHFIDFQRNNREMLEENYLKTLGLPTRTEIDEINRDVYLQKKQVKELRGRIKDLSGGNA
jgi:hypothetical protein